MTKLYHINLNKGEDKAARIAQQLEMQRWAIVVLLILIAGGITWFGLARNSDLDNLIAQRQDQIQKVQDELQELQDTGTNLSKRDILNLAKLENSRLLWTNKLIGLGEEVNKEMALTSVRYEKGQLYVAGVYKVRPNMDPLDKVMEFVDKLRRNEKFNQDFRNIVFYYSEDIVQHDQPSLLFEIHCKIDKKYLSKTVQFTKNS